MNPWQLQEAELLRKEYEYVKNFTPLEKLLDDHVHYVLALTLVSMLAFWIGIGIGVLL